MKRKKPSRDDLVRIIAQLQHMIGNARGDHWADTDQTAFVRAQKTLGNAFELCVDATGYFPQQILECKSRNGWNFDNSSPHI